MTRTTTRRTASNGVRRTLGVVGTTGLVGGLALVGMGAVAAPRADAATTTTVSKSMKASCIYWGQDLGIWSVDVTAELPTTVAPGAAYDAPALTVKVTTSLKAANTLRGLNVDYIYNGSSAAKYSVFGATQTAALTFPQTTIPATGALVTLAKGSGAAGSAPPTEGTYPVVVGDFHVEMTAHHSADDDGNVEPPSVLGVDCTMQGTDADRTLTNINVTNGSTTPPPSTTSTTEPTTPPPSTSTTEPTTPPPSTTSTSEPTTPPPSPTSTLPTTLPPTGTTAPSPSGATVTLNRSSYAPGDPFTLSASGFKPNEKGISIVAHSAPVTLATNLTADANGNLTYSGTIPNSLAAGTHTIEVVGSVSGSATFTVVPASVVTPSTVQTGSVASTTGGNMITAAGFGLTAIGAVALGGAVLAGRKREQQ